MKSIKEKAEETYPKTTATSDLCNEKFVEGANYVLEEIETISKVDIGSYKSKLDRIKNVIEQLKK